MNDLAEQLREYLDGIVEPVSRAEATGLSEPVVRITRRKRRTAILVSVVVALVVAAGASLLWNRDGEPPTILPATAPGVALTARGPADCSAVLTPQASLLVAVTLSNRHALCVTEDGNTTTAYFDGRKGVSNVGAPLSSTSSVFGGAGSVKGRLIMVGNIPDDAHGLRIIFCNNQSLDLLPLNSTPPRFVAAAISMRPSGFFRKLQPIDSAGQSVGQRSGPGRAACAPTR